MASEPVNYAAVEALCEYLDTLETSSDASTTEKPLRGWWAADPTAHPAPPPPPASPLPPSPAAPQPLWPHHLLSGDTSPLPAPPTTDPSPGAARAAAEGRSPLPLRPLYAGVFLAGPSRHRLLMRCPPLHATVYAHHVTLRYFGYEPSAPADVAAGVAACAALPLGVRVAMGADGVAANDRVQALKVTLPAWLLAHADSDGGSGGGGGGGGGKKKKRKKGKGKINAPKSRAPHHVTISTVEGVPASESGALLAAAPGGPDPIQGLRVLHGAVGVCLSDRTVVYSLEEVEEAVGGGGEEEGPAEPGASGSDSGDGSCSGGIVDLVSIMRRVLPPVQQLEDGGAAGTAESRPADAVCGGEGPAGSALPPSARAGALRGGGAPIGPQRSHLQRGKRRLRLPAPPAAAPALQPERPCRPSPAAAAPLVPAPPAPATIEDADAERAAMEAHWEAHLGAVAARDAAGAAGRAREAAAHAAAARRAATAAASARRRASAAAFLAHNADHLNSFQLDLHGLHVPEALAVLRRYLDGLEAVGHPGGVLLHIVTGFGRHSEGGRARVLPAVVGLLSNAGHLFDLEEENPGAIRVLIGGGSDL